jgi:outer membrane protein W
VNFCRLKKGFITVIFCLLTTNILAAPHTKGAYVEGNIGPNIVRINLFGFSITAFNSVGVNANIGYQFNPYLAPELGFTHIAGANYFDAAMKAIYPFELGKYDFNLFGKLGAAYIYDGSSHEVAPYIGVGTSYAISNALDINIQGQGVIASNVDSTLLSLGLTYHFN